MLFNIFSFESVHLYLGSLDIMEDNVCLEYLAVAPRLQLNPIVWYTGNSAPQMQWSTLPFRIVLDLWIAFQKEICLF